MSPFDLDRWMLDDEREPAPVVGEDEIDYWVARAERDAAPIDDSDDDVDIDLPEPRDPDDDADADDLPDDIDGAEDYIAANKVRKLIDDEWRPIFRGAVATCFLLTPLHAVVIAHDLISRMSWRYPPVAAYVLFGLPWVLGCGAILIGAAMASRSGRAPLIGLVAAGTCVALSLFEITVFAYTTPAFPTVPPVEQWPALVLVIFAAGATTWSYGAHDFSEAGKAGLGAVLSCVAFFGLSWTVLGCFGLVPIAIGAMIILLVSARGAMHHPGLSIVDATAQTRSLAWIMLIMTAIGYDLMRSPHIAAGVIIGAAAGIALAAARWRARWSDAYREMPLLSES